MSQLLVIGNPARRKAKRRTAAKRKASPAQLKARAKFAAMARARSKTRKSRTARKATPSTARSNPIMAKRRTHKRRTTAARSTPVRHHAKRRARRNPISGRGVSAALMPAIKAAGMGAAGAIGVDAAFGFVQSYLPASLSTPTDNAGATQYGYYVAKGAAAFGIAMLLRKAIGATKAATVLNGSLTVTIHDLLKTFVAANIPSVTLAKYTGVPTPMGQGLRGMPGGRVLPPLPASQSLRAYVNSSVGTREAMLR